MDSMTCTERPVKARSRDRIDFGDGRVSVTIRDALGFVNDARAVWACVEGGLYAVVRLTKAAARRLLRAQRAGGVATFPLFLDDEGGLILGA